MKILITGFEPFENMDENPSSFIASELPRFSWNFDLDSLILPVSFKRAWPSLQERIADFSPSIIVSFGVARKRQVISLEKKAFNWRESKITDNDGYKASGEVINSFTPTSLETRLSINKMRKALTDQGIGCEISNDPGRYVCNDLYYQSLNYCKDKDIASVFIHIPHFHFLEKEVLLINCAFVLNVHWSLRSRSKL